MVGVDEALVGGECPYYGLHPLEDDDPARRPARRGAAGRPARAARPRCGRTGRRWRPGSARGHRRLGRHRVEPARGRRGHASSAATAGWPAPAVRVERRRHDVRAPRAAWCSTPAPTRAAARSTGWRTRRTGPTARWSGSTELPGSLVVIGGGAIGLRAGPGLRPVRRRGDHAGGGATGSSPARSPRRARRSTRGAAPATASRCARGSTSSAVDHDGRLHASTSTARSSTPSQLLVAAGRRNNLADLGLDTVGLDPDADVVETDERMRAGERLWAIGDITGKGAFTHVSMYQAAVAVARHPRRGRAVGRLPGGQPGDVHRPRGRLGRAHRAAGARRRASRSGSGWPTSARVEPRLDARAGHDGVIKLVADADRGVLVGATVVAPSGGEMLGLLVTAVHAEVPVARLRTMHFAYPTFHRAIETALTRLGPAPDRVMLKSGRDGSDGRDRAASSSGRGMAAATTRRRRATEDPWRSRTSPATRPAPASTLAEVAPAHGPAQRPEADRLDDRAGRTNRGARPADPDRHRRARRRHRRSAGRRPAPGPAADRRRRRRPARPAGHARRPGGTGGTGQRRQRGGTGVRRAPRPRAAPVHDRDRLPRPARRAGRARPRHLGLARQGPQAGPAARRAEDGPRRARLRDGPAPIQQRLRRPAHHRVHQPQGRRRQDHRRARRGLHVRHRPRWRRGRVGQQRDPRHARHPRHPQHATATPPASCWRTSSSSATSTRPGSATSARSSARRATPTSTCSPPTSGPT